MSGLTEDNVERGYNRGEGKALGGKRFSAPGGSTLTT